MPKPATTLSVTSIFIWIAVFVGYGAGAAICGALELRYHVQAIWLPVAIVSVVILAATTSGLRIAAKRPPGVSM